MFQALKPSVQLCTTAIQTHVPSDSYPGWLLTREEITEDQDGQKDEQEGNKRKNEGTQILNHVDRTPGKKGHELRSSIFTCFFG